MATSVHETGSGFEQILKNTEFENEQQLWAIKAEQERIQTCCSQLKEKQIQILHLEKIISDLDDHAKQLHKQFIINRDNCESLKRTTVVLADHEEALKAKLLATEKETESERCLQIEALAKYDRIWQTYKVKYDNMEKSQELKKVEAKLNKLYETNSTLEMEIHKTKESMLTLQQRGKKCSLNTIVLKLATLHVETNKAKKQMTLKNDKALQLQGEVDTLYERIRAEELKKNKREKRQQQANSMDVEPNQNQAHHISTVTAVQSLLPPLSKTAPLPKQSTPVPSPSPYRLELPRLSIPSFIRTPTQRSASVPPSTNAMPSTQRQPNSLIPNLAVNTSPATSRPTLPQLQTIIQSTSHVQLPLITAPNTASSTQSSSTLTISSLPQVSLSIPIVARSVPVISPLVITQSTASSQPAQTPNNTTVEAQASMKSQPQIEQQISSNKVRERVSLNPVQPQQPSSVPSLEPTEPQAGKTNHTRSNSMEHCMSDVRETVVDNVEQQNQALTQETQNDNIAIGIQPNDTQEDNLYSGMFTDSNGGDFFKQMQDNVDQSQIQFAGEESNGLFFGVEGSLDDLGQSPEMSAGEVFMGGFDLQFSSENNDSAAGFSFFPSEGESDTTKQTTSIPDFSFFGGDTTSSSFF